MREVGERWRTVSETEREDPPLAAFAAHLLQKVNSLVGKVGLISFELAEKI